MTSTDTPTSIDSILASNTVQNPTKTDILDKIKLEFSWNSGGFGSIMIADFTIQNTSTLAIKDVVIVCDHYSKSDTKIDSNTREIYELFEANSQTHHPDFNMGFMHDQANSSLCYIKDFKLVK
jgi:phosphopantothenoylcysteine synthetase/decarboxylase